MARKKKGVWRGEALGSKDPKRESREGEGNWGLKVQKGKHGGGEDLEDIRYEKAMREGEGAGRRKAGKGEQRG